MKKLSSLPGLDGFKCVEIVISFSYLREIWRFMGQIGHDYARVLVRRRIELVATLGMGGFGRVELVSIM